MCLYLRLMKEVSLFVLSSDRSLVSIPPEYRGSESSARCVALQQFRGMSVAPTRPILINFWNFNRISSLCLVGRGGWSGDRDGGTVDALRIHEGDNKGYKDERANERSSYGGWRTLGNEEMEGKRRSSLDTDINNFRLKYLYFGVKGNTKCQKSHFSSVLSENSLTAHVGGETRTEFNSRFFCTSAALISKSILLTLRTRPVQFFVFANYIQTITVPYETGIIRLLWKWLSMSR